MWVHGKNSWSEGRNKCIFSGDNSYNLFHPPRWYKVTPKMSNPPSVKIVNWIISVFTTAERPPKYVYIAEKNPRKIINMPILIILLSLIKLNSSLKTASAA